MRQIHSIFLLLLLVVVGSACQSPAAHSVSAEGDTIPMQYARNITMIRYPDHVKVELANPWGSGLLASYVLSSSNSDAVANDDATHITVPLHNALVFTAVHCGLFCELGKEDCIGGVCERQYIHCLTRSVVDCGNGMSPNQERIIQLSPDAMLVSPFENNTSNDKLSQFGIPIVQCAEYMSQPPLVVPNG